ncbi:uncharacterized protein LOC126669116 [Mercurialis annua]|uniref:uncharacterized protein LOC126669116 n=1 Tax=Mercurialis annua TaxID=3986 RepID=UPI00215FCC4B|nr:uncharacterized protein LOC126669116 [Mercurialis annua]
MSRELRLLHSHHYYISRKSLPVPSVRRPSLKLKILPVLRLNIAARAKPPSLTVTAAAAGGRGGGVSRPPLDLTEDNVRQVLADARTEFGQLFDTSINITGQAELAELDGPFVKISLKGRFWHERSLVLARLGNYLKQRIPEIVEVEIEDEKQLDDSPENF